MTKACYILLGMLLLVSNAGAADLLVPPGLSWEITVVYLDESAFPNTPQTRPVSATVEQHGRYRKIRIIYFDKTVGEFWETPQYLLTARPDGKGVEILPRTALQGFPVPLTIDLLFNGLGPSSRMEHSLYKDRQARLYTIKPQSGSSPANAIEAFLSTERHIWVDAETHRPLAISTDAVFCEFRFYPSASGTELPSGFSQAVEALEETATRLPPWASPEK